MIHKTWKSKWLAALLAGMMLLSSLPLTAIAAPASNIPAEMLDNVYLDALAYTGYNVQAQKDDGTIFKKYGSSAPAAVRSDITYGTGPSGLETVDDPTTKTGKAPNIAKYEASGLCCASYVSYVLYNYLPNVAGIDTSDTPCPTNPRSSSSYNKAANDWIADGKARRIGFTQNADGSSFQPDEEIPIGSLVVFKHIPTDKIAHVAIYIGSYNNRHFVTHVANDRGPEISTVAGMSKGDYPEAVVQIVAPEFVEAYGAIAVQKRDTDGNALAGAYFVATSVEDADLQFLIGPTDSDGYAISHERIPYGQYICKETVFPVHYRAYGETEWTVTVDETNNGVATFTAVNEIIPGEIRIVKESEDGIVEGIEFTIIGNGVNQTIQTGQDGTVSLSLKPGVYTVTEAEYDTYIPQKSQTITVASGGTAIVHVNNELRRGSLTVTKTSEDGMVEGTQFKLTGTSLSGHTVEQYATADTAGIATFENVLIGTDYVLEEIGVPEKYILPSPVNVNIEWDTVAETGFHNELKRGSLMVTKESEDGLVQGMEFHLYGSSISGIYVDEYATTNADGVAIFDDIPVATGLTLEEVNTAGRYVIPDAQIHSVAWNEVTEATVINVLKKWRADVFKLDYDLYFGEDLGGVDLLPVLLSLESDALVEKLGTPYGESRGEASLEGAVYGVYRNGVLVDEYTTDRNGYFMTAYYPCEDDAVWALRELSPSEGYLLNDDEVYLNTVCHNFTDEYNTIFPDVYEHVVKGKISIAKHSDDGSTQIETPEKGAKFYIYLKSAGSYEKAKETERALLVCDEQGYAESPYLPYGVYEVEQFDGITGIERLPPFTVTISEHQKIYRFMINNAVFSSYLRVLKTDSTTGKPIAYAGAGFQIYDPDGNLVTMKCTYPRPTVMDTFYTSEDGSLLTPEKLPFGKGFRLVEVSAPYGYVLDPTPVYFDVISENATKENGLTIIHLDKKNEPQMGTITIEKIGEVFSTVAEKDGIYTPVYERKGLEGAVFGVYAVEDTYTFDGTLRYAAGEKVTTVTTSTDGTATTEPLFLGKFELREEKAPYGMVLSEEPLRVELVYAGQEVTIATAAVTALNERQKVVIRLFKKLETDDHYGIGLGSEYQNIRFGLYVAEAVRAADGTEIPKDGLLEIAGPDRDGLAVFAADLPVGAKLYVKEYATDSHYLLSDTAFPVAFAYEDAKVATVQLVVNDGEVIDNVIIRGDIKGLKLDEEHNPVADAVFGLFRADESAFTEETALVTAISGEDGIFIFEDIPYGNWVIQELSCPEHLVLSDDRIEVTISEQGQLIELEVVNEIIFGRVEGVKIDDKINPIEGVIFGLFASDTTEFTKENALALSETKADGLFDFTGLRFGNYRIKELSCPEAFVMCEDVFEVSITEDGQVVVLTVTNKRISGKVQVHKINSEDHNETLSGAIFELYLDANTNGVFDVDVDTLHGTLTETEVGIYELDGLSNNGYFLFEAQSPDGFTKDDRYFYFRISADGEVITVENEIGVGFTNEPIPTHEPECPDSPQTGDDSHILHWSVLSGASLAALMIMMAIGRKKHRLD